MVGASENGKSGSLHKRTIGTSPTNGANHTDGAVGTRVPAFPDSWRSPNGKATKKTSVSALSSYKTVVVALVLLGSLSWVAFVEERPWDDMNTRMPLVSSSTPPASSLQTRQQQQQQITKSEYHREQQTTLQASQGGQQTLMMEHKDTNNTRDAIRGAGRRPHFIFHIGPPKTATTTLQYSLTYYQDVLPRDGYHYLGQLMKNPNNMWNHDHGPILLILKDRGCMGRVYKWRQQRSGSWHQRENEPECWGKLRELLKEHRRRNESIILSEENFSIKYIPMGNVLDSVDWIALAELLEEVDFRPLILLGYRRLYDILPSAKQQWDRWTRTQLSLNAWPGQKHPLHPDWPTAVGRPLLPLFPSVLDDSRLYDNYVPRRIPGTIQYSYTDYLVKVINPHLPVRLVNMHMVSPTMSLRTYFLCHVLPFAPASCAQSIADDKTDPPAVYNQEESLFYDAIACGAAERAWFNTTAYQRHEVVLALQEYYKQEHGGEVQKDVPLSCPPRDEVEVVLERSLAKESQLWPPHLAEAWREDHIAGFEKAVERKKYCWIDVNATLNTQDHWKKWFTSSLPLLPESPLPIRPEPRQRRPGFGRVPRSPQLRPRPVPPPVKPRDDDDSDDSEEEDGSDDGDDGEDSGGDDDDSGDDDDDDE